MEVISSYDSLDIKRQEVSARANVIWLGCVDSDVARNSGVVVSEVNMHHIEIIRSTKEGKFVDLIGVWFDSGKIIIDENGLQVNGVMISASKNSRYRMDHVGDWL